MSAPDGYYISKYEITNAQWASFLNEVASYADLGLWNSAMKISRTNDGVSNTWLYTADEGYENHPVTHVGFANAAKFANWMTTDSISEGIYHRLDTNNYYTTRGYNATDDLELGEAAASPCQHLTSGTRPPISTPVTILICGSRVTLVTPCQYGN